MEIVAYAQQDRRPLSESVPRAPQHPRPMPTIRSGHQRLACALDQLEKMTDDFLMRLTPILADDSPPSGEGSCGSGANCELAKAFNEQADRVEVLCRRLLQASERLEL